MTDKELRNRARRILPRPVGENESIESLRNRLEHFPAGKRLVQSYDNYVGALGGHI